jgi:hypothetical protein
VLSAEFSGKSIKYHGGKIGQKQAAMGYNFGGFFAASSLNVPFQ